MASSRTEKWRPSLIYGVAAVVVAATIGTLVPYRYAVSITLLICASTAMVAIPRLPRGLRTVLFVALALRTGVAFYYTVVAPNADLLWDGYQTRALQIYNGGVHSLASGLSTGAYLYSWVTALAYLAVGAVTPSLMRTVNVLLSTGVVAAVYYGAHCLWGRRAAMRAAWAAAFFPSLIEFSGVFSNREPLIVLPLSMAFVFLIRWELTRKARWYVLTVVSLLVSGAFHTGILLGGAGLLVATAGWSAISFFRRNVRPFIQGAIVVVLGVLLVGWVAKTGWGLQKLHNQPITVAEVGRVEHASAEGRAAYLSSLTMRSPLDAVWQTPLRLAYLLLSPFPWMLRNGRDLLGFFDAALYAGLMIKLWRSRRIVGRSGAARTVLWVLSIMLVVFAVAVSNYGTALRHRAKFAPVLLMLVPLANPRTSATPGRKENDQ